MWENNKQNKNTNLIITRQDNHLTQTCPSEETQTNKQKLSTNLTLYKTYTNHWTNLRRAETKRKKEFKPGKRRPQTLSIKKKNEKAEKYYTDEGTN